jgi:hypothetical protein
MEEFAAALAEFFRQSWPVLALPREENVALREVPGKSVSQPGRGEPPPRRRSRGVWLALVALAVLVLAASLWSTLGGWRAPEKTDTPTDPFQPGTHWWGISHVRGVPNSGDVQVTITKRDGERFEGVYTSERGQYEWLIAGAVGKETIAWRFTQVIREKHPKGVVEHARVKGTYHGQVMDVIYKDADSTADLELQLRP